MRDRRRAKPASSVRSLARLRTRSGALRLRRTTLPCSSTAEATRVGCWTRSEKENSARAATSTRLPLPLKYLKTLPPRLPGPVGATRYGESDMATRRPGRQHAS